MRMSNRRSAGIIAAALGCTLATITSVGVARAGEDAKYPTNWSGQWTHAVDHTLEIQGTFDQTKPWGPGQQAPLTPEYQKVLADSMADQAEGGLGNYPTAHCLP